MVECEEDMGGKQSEPPGQTKEHQGIHPVSLQPFNTRVTLMEQFAPERPSFPEKVERGLETFRRQPRDHIDDHVLGTADDHRGRQEGNPDAVATVVTVCLAALCYHHKYRYTYGPRSRMSVTHFRSKIEP